MKLRDKIGSDIKAIREAAGMTQVAFAEAIGMKQSVVARLESGKSIPRISTLQAIAKAMGLKLVVSFQSRKSST